MQLFFDAELTKDHNTHSIGTEESNHILRVLRKSVGDRIYLTNGKGDGFLAEISGVKSKKCEIAILEKFNEKPLPYHLHIAIAPPKSSDRFEFFLEKATEIGVSKITPILCTNSERKRINTKRALKILQSAMKQSQRLFLPQLNDLMTLDNFLTLNHGEATKLIAHCEEHKKASLKDKLDSSRQYCGLIGPEGDFSHEEIEDALKNDFQPVSLGEKRLRTETAGLYFCQALAFNYSL